MSPLEGGQKQRAGKAWGRRGRADRGGRCPRRALLRPGHTHPASRTGSGGRWDPEDAARRPRLGLRVTLPLRPAFVVVNS